MTVNSSSAVTIETGCNTDPAGCSVHFSPAPTQDSWGKRSRKISWSRYVVPGTFVRIRICSNKDCEDVCTSGTGYTSTLAKNSLSRFSVDGRDFTNAITEIATGSVAGFNDGQAGLVPNTCYLKAACTGPRKTTVDEADACCQWYKIGDAAPVVSWAAGGLEDLPVGTEIVFGPIGQVFL